ncbi:MAG: malate dehydrogenase [Flavobacteriales bacterium TMED84]|nr:MAG: malate dehydrogenase [Flavobacteriales bacterium TMED84]|tara:strand:- start:8082 stop:9017 length:936 start_codon:yes stop_codon:yes gene_type:complete
MKVTIVGAGAVGASCAEYIALKNFCSEVVLIDIKQGFAEGKSMDLMQTASLNNFDTKIIGSTNNYSHSKDSSVAVITSGIPRKPGMTREELIGINAGIVKNVTENLLKYSPNCIIIVVSNPMDTMTYLLHKEFKINKNKVIGMGGALDSARFKYRLSEALNCPASDVEGLVIGAHSDAGMIPLDRIATYKGVPVRKLLTSDALKNLVNETKVGGATLTGLLGTSAWYAPGAAVSSIVQSIICNQNKVFTCSTYLNGEYDLSKLCIGVPVIIGSNGIEKIINLELDDTEKKLLMNSADAVLSTNKLLDNIKF